MLNRTELQGRFCKEPELVKVGNYVKSDFTIAWSEKYKETERRCFMRCTAWNAQAEFICKYFNKGSECVVEGRNITDTWEKDGQTQSKTYLEIEKIHFCGSKSSTGTASNETPAANGKEDFMNIPDNIDEEIPFT